MENFLPDRLDGFIAGRALHHEHIANNKPKEDQEEILKKIIEQAEKEVAKKVDEAKSDEVSGVIK